MDGQHESFVDSDVMDIVLNIVGQIRIYFYLRSFCSIKTMSYESPSKLIAGTLTKEFYLGWIIFFNHSSNHKWIRVNINVVG